MRSLPAPELERWIAHGKVLERDSRGPKVVHLSDGCFLKIFYTRKPIVLARLMPLAERFSRNAILLARLKILTPEVIETFWIDRAQGLSGCLYNPLEGKSLEQLWQKNQAEVIQLLPQLSRFIAQLHAQRLYFRSLHLGNILKVDNTQFGLIDFLDLRQKLLPLSRSQIQRNFRHLEGYLGRRKIHNFPLQHLQALYWKHVQHRT